MAFVTGVPISHTFAEDETACEALARQKVQEWCTKNGCAPGHVEWQVMSRSFGPDDGTKRLAIKFEAIETPVLH
jgi:hypothetical protein